MPTRAKETRPTKRVVVSARGDEYIVAVGATTLTLKPKGTRSRRVLVDIDWGSLYLRLLTAKIDAEKRERRAARKTTNRRNR